MIIIGPRADNDHYPPCKNSGRTHYLPGNEEEAIICPVHGNYPALCLLTKSALLYKNGQYYMGGPILLSKWWSAYFMGSRQIISIITWAGRYCLVKGGQYIFHDQGGIMEIMPPMGGIMGRHHGKYAAHGRHHGNYAAHGRHNFHDAALVNTNISHSM